MNTAKFSMSLDTSEATPELPKLGLLKMVGISRWAGSAGSGGTITWSSGSGLGEHCPFPWVLSLGKVSLVTRISTLAASPEKISSDLFCAFDQNRVMV